jgi:hypothetical protein
LIVQARRVDEIRRTLPVVTGDAWTDDARQAA